MLQVLLSKDLKFPSILLPHRSIGRYQDKINDRYLQYFFFSFYIPINSFVFLIYCKGKGKWFPLPLRKSPYFSQTKYCCKAQVNKVYHFYYFWVLESQEHGWHFDKLSRKILRIEFQLFLLHGTYACFVLLVKFGHLCIIVFLWTCFRADDFNDPIHLERISTLNTFIVRDLGSIPNGSLSSDYTSDFYRINEW